MPGQLADKVVIVTGAGGGIGAAAAKIFARNGGLVVAAGRTEASVKRVCSKISGAGGTAVYVTADVATPEGAKSIVETAMENYGRLDCAFNNAGIDGSLAPTAEYPEAEFDEVIRINLKGVWLCMREQISAMLKNGGGAILNNASALGKVGQFSMPAYCASKAGVAGLTKAAALDYSSQGIRSNVISPGVVETPMMKQQMETMPELRQLLLERHPIGRLGSPEEIAEAAAWILSDAASFMTGSDVSVDGGYLAI
ncbi:SDR family NAD(P)-dependent oxidoreductase [Qipengyuania sp.]|uniref:SDR family NAD(P)-dependent oxidoreductase n=1 Tax=Qipengyuania sp. TaxID=2004515 RepID=UPI003BAD2488